MNGGWTNKDFASQKANTWKKKPRSSHFYRPKTGSNGFFSTSEIERKIGDLHFSADEGALAIGGEEYEGISTRTLDKPFDVELLKILNHIFTRNLFPGTNQVVVTVFMWNIEEDSNTRRIYGTAVNTLLEALNAYPAQRKIFWEDVIDIIFNHFGLNFRAETLLSEEARGEEEEEPAMVDVERDIQGFRQLLQERCPDYYSHPAVSSWRMEPIALNLQDKEEEERLLSELSITKEERKKLAPDAEDKIREYEEMKGLVDHLAIITKRMRKSRKVVIRKLYHLRAT